MKRRWLVKAGSQMVCEGGPLLMRAWMEQVAELRRRHRIEVVWVTSGAIAWATTRTGFKRQTRELPQKQALSAIGQPMIMDQYLLAVQATGLVGAQVLLTAGDMKNRVRRGNLLNTLNQLLAWKVVPILNENDAVATEEIKFGDNDSLGAQVAAMIGAERLVLLTDVDGLYDADPKTNRRARLIPHLARVSKNDFARAATGKSKVGTGGMYSKLLAADRARRAGIVTHLMRADRAHGLLDIARGLAVGTQIGGLDGSRGN